MPDADTDVATVSAIVNTAPSLVHQDAPQTSEGAQQPSHSAQAEVASAEKDDDVDDDVDMASNEAGPSDAGPTAAEKGKSKTDEDKMETDDAAAEEQAEDVEMDGQGPKEDVEDVDMGGQEDEEDVKIGRPRYGYTIGRSLDLQWRFEHRQAVHSYLAVLSGCGRRYELTLCDKRPGARRRLSSAGQ